MVFLRFLELAKSGNVTKADQLFKTIASVFEIDDNELNKFKTFIFYSSAEELTSSDFLLIDAFKKPENIVYKHLRQKNIDGKIAFMYSKLIGYYIFMANHS